MLKKAIAAGVSIDTVHSTPNFSNLESQPRFQDLLKKSHPVSGAGIT